MTNDARHSVDLLAARMRPGDFRNREWSLAADVYRAMLQASCGSSLKASFLSDGKEFLSAFEAWEAESAAFARAENVVRELLCHEVEAKHRRRKELYELAKVPFVLLVGFAAYAAIMYAAGWFFLNILTPEVLFSLLFVMFAIGIAGAVYRRLFDSS